MLGWLWKLSRKLHAWWVTHCPDLVMEGAYLKWGRRLGLSLRSKFHFDGCGRFQRILAYLACWEKEYARRGFRPLSIQAWDESINALGWHLQIPSFGQKLYPGETIIFYACLYYERLKSPDDELKKFIDDYIPEYLVCVEPDTEVTFEADDGEDRSKGQRQDAGRSQNDAHQGESYRPAQ